MFECEGCKAKICFRMERRVGGASSTDTAVVVESKFKCPECGEWIYFFNREPCGVEKESI